jgi:uncharacterized cupin superfamily protein
MAKIDISKTEQDRGSGYPPPFDEPCRGKTSRRLSDAAGLTQFGVQLVRLPPGAWSSQRHWHRREDEFVFVVAGELTLVTDAGEELLHAGDCAGFKAGVRDGHHLQNRSSADATFLVVGTRDAEDSGEYADIDMTFNETGGAYFRHKDGTPY